MNLYYSFIEPCPLPIINYYRLVQYDWDGEFEIYGPIAIDNRKFSEKAVIQQNPFINSMKCVAWEERQGTEL